MRASHSYHWLGRCCLMLNNASGFRQVYVACGYTDLRRGIDGLAKIIHGTFQLDPFQEGILFLFCGRRSDRIKGLLWEGDGFLLLYKRLEAGAFQWPRNQKEALAITPQQYTWLMQGLSLEPKKYSSKLSPSNPL